MIKEWNFLRVFACLSVVLLHSTTNMKTASGEFPTIENFQLFRILLTYATPTFILLSEIILANKYSEVLPSDFLRKRMKFLLGPFLSFAIIDALIVAYISVDKVNVIGKIIKNIQGDYAGYFILIIFQFYILHYIITRFKIPVKNLLFIGTAVMIVYLSYITQPDFEYNLYWKLPFIGWLGYFVVAYTIGIHYRKIAAVLKQYKWFTLIPVYYTGYLVSQSYEAGITMVNSIRVDIFPFTVAMTLALLAWGQTIPNNRIVQIISNYSLGIYLLHWQIQRIIAPYIANVYQNSLLGVLVLFIISLILSMIIIYIISLLPFGKYIVGNTKRKYAK